MSDKPKRHKGSKKVKNLNPQHVMLHDEGFAGRHGAQPYIMPPMDHSEIESGMDEPAHSMD